MTYEALIDRLISDGIAEVRKTYADPKEHHKRDGAIEGFEACRGKTPDELVDLWRSAEDRAHQIASLPESSIDINLKDYWKQCHHALQIEFVLNVLSVGMEKSLLAHLPTARGAMKYAEIVGVRGEGVSA